MKDMDYGQGYKYAHDYPGHFVEQQNLPNSLQDKRYYTPSDQGYEKQVVNRLKGWWHKKKKTEEPEATEEMEETEETE